MLNTVYLLINYVFQGQIQKIQKEGAEETDDAVLHHSDLTFKDTRTKRGRSPLDSPPPPKKKKIRPCIILWTTMRLENFAVRNFYHTNFSQIAK